LADYGHELADPEPAHHISIWLGALKRRTRRLVGRRPTVDFRAGRDAREVIRLPNVGGVFTTSKRGFLQDQPEQWVEEMLPVALENGVSMFILAADDPGTIEL
jgi:hypothetical protein